jgi:hypothetical protein
MKVAIALLSCQAAPASQKGSDLIHHAFLIPAFEKQKET